MLGDSMIEKLRAEGTTAEKEKLDAMGALHAAAGTWCDSGESHHPIAFLEQRRFRSRLSLLKWSRRRD